MYHETTGNTVSQIFIYKTTQSGLLDLYNVDYLISK